MLTEKKYKLLVFDWDGTLMDSMGHIVRSAQATARELSLEVPDIERVRQGIGLISVDFIQFLFPQSNIDEATNIFYKYYEKSGDREQLFAGTLETLEKLRQKGYTLAIATNKNRESLYERLNHYKLTHLFAGIRCGDDEVSKPDPEVLRGLMKDLGVTPALMLMIGDTEFDMQVAMNAAVDALAVSYGIQSKAHLLKYNPIGCIDDIRDLQKVL